MVTDGVISVLGTVDAGKQDGGGLESDSFHDVIAICACQQVAYGILPAFKTHIIVINSCCVLDLV